MSLRNAGIDMRGFSWPLLPLEHKLGWEQAAAQARLADALATLQRARLRHGELQAWCEAQQARALVADGSRLDPVAHLHGLRYLHGIASAVDAAAHEVSACERALAMARAACVRCDSRLDGLRAVHAAAARIHAREAALRQDRLADAAWLVHDQARRAARGEVV